MDDPNGRYRRNGRPFGLRPNGQLRRDRTGGNADPNQLVGAQDPVDEFHELSRAMDSGRQLTWAQRVIREFVGETMSVYLAFDRIRAGKTIVVSRLPWDDKARMTELVVEVNEQLLQNRGSGDSQALSELQTYLFRRFRHLDLELIEHLVRRLSEYPGKDLYHLPTGSVIAAARRLLSNAPMPLGLQKALEDLATVYKVHADQQDQRAIHTRIVSLCESGRRGQATLAKKTHSNAERSELEDSAVDVQPIEFKTGEAWTEALMDLVSRQSPERASSWHRLLKIASEARSSTPRTRWLQGAEQEIANVTDTFVADLSPVLRLVGKPGDPKKFRAAFEHRADPTQIHELHGDVLRGLVHMLGMHRTTEACQTLKELAIACAERTKARVPRSLKIARACITALAMHENQAASRTLAVLRGKVQQVSLRTEIDRRMDSLGHLATNVPELAELGTPDYDFDADHVYRRQFGNWSAEIHVVPPGQPSIVWRDSNGKTSSTVPPAIRPYHRDAIDAFRRHSRRVNGELATQKVRIERLFISRAKWPYDEFAKKYLHQPLIGPLVKDLVWKLEFATRDSKPAQARSAIWTAAGWVDANDCPLSFGEDDCVVTVWHPIQASHDEVSKWKDWLAEHAICQPFNQVYRECHRYVGDQKQVADSRFAGRYLELRRSCQIVPDRQWKWSSVTTNGDEITPMLGMPDYELTAAWHTFDPVASDSEDRIPHNTGDLEFRSTSTGKLVPLASVPPIVFSEVAREIETFLLQYGSPANIRTFHVAGSSRRMIQYQRDVNSRPLTKVGVARRDAVARFLRDSRFSNVWSVDARHLRVQGQLSSYKIDFGNGSIGLADGRNLYPFGIAWSRVRNAMPPGLGDERLPFAGDVCLMNIVRDAIRLTKDHALSEQQLKAQIHHYLDLPMDGIDVPPWIPKLDLTNQ